MQQFNYDHYACLIAPPPSFPQFSPDGATATVSLGGETRAMATVTASLEAPYPDR